MSAEAAGERTRLRLLRFTPLRDIFRGRLTGRLDVASLVGEAALPDPLPQLVRDVVRRTRLFRLEQVSVAEELVGHFRDGVKAGRSAAQLAADFGDPARAARLIRRGKRRNRPLVWRVTARTLQATTGVFGLVLLLYGFEAARFFMGSPNPSVDYLAIVNAPSMAGSPEEYAWPEYRAALLLLSPPPTLGYMRRPRPGEPDWAVVETYLEANAPAVERLRNAAARSVLGYEIGFGIAEADRVLWPHLAVDTRPSTARPMFGVQTPYLYELRELALLILDDARRAAALGDSATTLADIEAAVSMAGHVRGSGFVINEWVSLAMLTAAIDATGELLHDHPDLFADDQLTGLAHRLSAIGGGGPLRLSLSGERLWFADLLQHAYTDDGAGDGHLTWDGLKLLSMYESVTQQQTQLPDAVAAAIGPAVSALGASRAELMAKYDRLLAMVEADAALPLWQRGPSQVDVELDRMMTSRTESFMYLPIVLLMPSMGKVTVHAEVCTQQRDALLVAIALELFRRRHDAWPAEPGELVPSFLPAVPPDRYDGAPLKYRLFDGAPFLYVSGTDRDDDGGRMPTGDPDAAKRWLPPDAMQQIIAGPTQARAAKIPDGDWILWPPALPDALFVRFTDRDRPIYAFQSRRGR